MGYTPKRWKMKNISISKWIDLTTKHTADKQSLESNLNRKLELNGNSDCTWVLICEIYEEKGKKQEQVKTMKLLCFGPRHFDSQLFSVISIHL